MADVHVENRIIEIFANMRSGPKGEFGGELL
jgi:hypothetical protein